jgi:hypothetical protein
MSNLEQAPCHFGKSLLYNNTVLEARRSASRQTPIIGENHTAFATSRNVRKVIE